MKKLNKKIELSIIIVDYNSEKFSLPLVKKLLLDNKINFEIIFVDNNPNGKANELAQSEFGNKIKIIKAKENKGFGAGNNLGAKLAQGKYLLLLNPDTELVDDALEKMLDFMSKHAEVGALTPLILQPDKTPQRHFFGHFQTLSRMILRNQASSLKQIHPDFFYTEMITAAALMIRKELYGKLEGFDENFFMYIEDEDLCYRIVDLGLKNAVLTTAKIIHFEGKSSTSLEKKRFYYQSQDYYWQKHYGGLKTALMKALRYPYILLQKLR